VRAAALERLVESEGLAALDRALFALDDADAGVRAAAMQAIGELGEPAVPELRAVVEHGSLEAARTAVGALRACGSAGARALQEIADRHPDPSVRMLAGVAIGREIGHAH
jgi:HEAT repeat protein